LLPLLDRQMSASPAGRRRLLNVSGGVRSACSLRQLSEWCALRFGPLAVSVAAPPRAFDIPWLVLDAFAAEEDWDWSPATPRDAIFEEIAAHASEHPDWLDVSHD
jgi:CDP-paratose 2-epimerase